MKNCTDIDQSKVLAEILPQESADLWWTIIQPKKYEGWELVNDGESFTTLSFAKQEHIALASYKEIPAWSLSALLNHLKQRYYVKLEHDGVSWGITCIEHDTKKEYNLYMFDEPVDACWGMMLRLNKDGLL